MAKAIANLSIKLALDSAGMDSGVARATASLAKLQKMSTGSLDKALSGASAARGVSLPTGGLGGGGGLSVESVTGGIKQLAGVAGMATGALSDLGGTLKGVGGSLVSLSLAGGPAAPVIAGVGVAAYGAGVAVDAMGAAFKTVGGVIGSAVAAAVDFGGTVAGALASVGMEVYSLTVKFLGLKTGLLDMVNVGVEFERQMSRVGALTGATGKQFDALREDARRLGRDTEFTAGQAAGAMSELSLAGFKPEEIQKSIDSVVRLSSVGMIGLEESASIGAGILRGFNLDASEMTHVTDVLSVALTNSATNMTELGEAMKYVAPIAAASGKGIEEVTAAVMVLSDKGLRGSMAGTALRGIMMKAANRTDEAREAMRQAGISFEDEGTGKLKHISDIMVELDRVLSKMGQAKQLEFLGNVFEMRAGTGAAALLASIRESAGSLRDRQKMLEQSAGTGARIAAQQLDNVWGAIKIVQSSWEGLVESVYDGFKGPLKQGIDALTEVFNAVRGGWGTARDAMAEATAPLARILEGLNASTRSFLLDNAAMWRQTFDAVVAVVKAAADAIAAGWARVSLHLPGVDSVKAGVTDLAAAVEYSATHMAEAWELGVAGMNLAWETMAAEVEYTAMERLPRAVALGTAALPLLTAKALGEMGAMLPTFWGYFTDVGFKFSESFWSGFVQLGRNAFQALLDASGDFFKFVTSGGREGSATLSAFSAERLLEGANFAPKDLPSLPELWGDRERTAAERSAREEFDRLRDQFGGGIAAMLNRKKIAAAGAAVVDEVFAAAKEIADRQSLMDAVVGGAAGLIRGILDPSALGGMLSRQARAWYAFNNGQGFPAGMVLGAAGGVGAAAFGAAPVEAPDKGPAAELMGSREAVQSEMRFFRQEQGKRVEEKQLEEQKAMRQNLEAILEAVKAAGAAPLTVIP